MGTLWTRVVPVLGLLVVIPTLGMARSGSGILRNDVDWTYAGDLNLQVGQGYLDDSDWAPIDEQMRFGAEIDFTNSSHYVGTVIGFSYASEDDTASNGAGSVKVDGRFLEFYLGARKVFYNFGRFRPFVGLGVAAYSVDVERRGVGTTLSRSDSDLGYGGYGEIGAYIDVYGPFHIGGNLRYGAGRIDLFDSRKNPGGLTLGVTVGTHWIDY